MKRHNTRMLENGTSLTNIFQVSLCKEFQKVYGEVFVRNVTRFARVSSTLVQVIGRASGAEPENGTCRSLLQYPPDLPSNGMIIYSIIYCPVAFIFALFLS